MLIKAGKSWRRSISFILLAGCCGEQTEAARRCGVVCIRGGKLLIGKKKKKRFRHIIGAGASARLDEETCFPSLHTSVVLSE